MEVGQAVVEGCRKVALLQWWWCDTTRARSNSDCCSRRDDRVTVHGDRGVGNC